MPRTFYISEKMVALLRIEEKEKIEKTPMCGFGQRGQIGFHTVRSTRVKILISLSRKYFRVHSDDQLGFLTWVFYTFPRSTSDRSNYYVYISYSVSDENF